MSKFFKDLNREELVSGALLGLVFVMYFKLLVLFTIPLCAIFWAMGGSGYGKNWRRIGVPVVLCIVPAWALHNAWLLLGAIPMHFMLKIGYGIPTFNPDHTIQDKGSLLGGIVYFYLAFQNMVVATFITRAVVGFLVASSMGAIAITDPRAFWVGVISFTIGYPLIVHFIE